VSAILNSSMGGFEMVNNNDDNIEEIEKKRKEDKLPGVFIALFIVTAIFLIVYIIRYTPAISGWTSEDDYLNVSKKPQIEAKKLSAENPFEHNSAAISEGQTIFADYCADCHGEDAKGDFGPNLTDSEWKYGSDDKSKFEVVKMGRGADTDSEMPSFKDDLTDEQIWKVLAFIDSLK
ncbi:MAG: hypothetical protein D6734_12320, partial [Candidatus Schekmanbacteria bacterium]